jgi:hypothetical protein
MDTRRKTYKVAYTVIERRGRKIWLRVGAAFDNADGTLSIVLDAVPTNGTLQICPHTPSDTRATARETGEDYVSAVPRLDRRTG